MTQAIITISEKTNRILNIVKAQLDLKDKSQAIERVVQVYEEVCMEPEMRPEYAQKLIDLRKNKGRSYKSVSDLKKRIENA